MSRIGKIKYKWARGGLRRQLRRLRPCRLLRKAENKKIQMNWKMKMTVNMRNAKNYKINGQGWASEDLGSVQGILVWIYV